jgi:hypothetical protein
MTKEWNRLDANGNGLVSGAEVDTWVQQHHKPLRQRAVIKQAVLQTLKMENGRVAEYIKRDTFPALLMNFVACTRAWIMFDSMNQTEENIGLKDKRIEFDEFKAGLMKLSHTITADVVQMEWGEVDSDGKGMVLFNEFCDWYQTKSASGWFQQLKHERQSQEVLRSQAVQEQAKAARASRKAKEQEEAANVKRSVLLTPFDWSDGASKPQAKANAALETQFVDVFKSGQDGVASSGLNKLWLQLDNNGNGLVSKQELTAWTEKKYAMLSIAAVGEAFATTLAMDGFGAKFVKRSMFKVKLWRCKVLNVKRNAVTSPASAESFFAAACSVSSPSEADRRHRQQLQRRFIPRAAAPRAVPPQPFPARSGNPTGHR